MNSLSTPSSYLSLFASSPKKSLPSLSSFSLSLSSLAKPLLFRTNNTSRLLLRERRRSVKMMMHSCAYQQQMRRGDAIVSSDDVVCPKPRRIGTHLTSSPLLHHINNQQRDAYDAKAGNELLDIILKKGDYGGEISNFQLASSPPFFNGSPPSRASNPLIQDEQFVNSKLNPYPPVFEPSPSPSPRKTGGGCVRATPMRRVEGFNCRNISAVA